MGSRKGRKNSNKVTNFERIKKKLDYFVLVCTRFYMMYSFVYLDQLFDPLDIILIFALLTFFLNRQTKHTKSFIPPLSKYEKKKFILRKSVAQELLIEKNRSLQKLKRKTTKKYQCLSNNKCQPVITTYLKKTKTPPTLEQKKVKEQT